MFRKTIAKEMEPLSTAPLHLRTAVYLARPGHWLKNILMIPGVVLAAKSTHTELSHLLWTLLVGLCGLCLIASANYVINEWLDVPSDRFHPAKKNRHLVVSRSMPVLVYWEYGILSVSGLGLAAYISPNYLLWAFFFWVLGILYNVRPIRTKDLPQVDILSEGLDNPIRLVMGWSLVTQNMGPPLTALLAYWMASAFQGAVKRLGELRFIGDREIARAYRRSFEKYTEPTLRFQSVLYAAAAVLFFGLFAILYRTEYLAMLPFFAILCAWYMIIGLKENSAAQDFMRLCRQEKLFVAYVLAGVCVFIVLTFVDFAWLRTSVSWFERVR